MNAEPIAYTIVEAAAAARTSRTKLYAAISSGALPMRKNGHRSIVLVSDLRRWLEQLPTASRKVG